MGKNEETMRQCEDGLAALTEQIEKNRGLILTLLGEIDDINLQQNPHILADYQMKIGVWENRLLETQLEARRLKRKMELLQVAANRGEQVDEATIESTLDKELAMWQTILQQAVASYEGAMERRLGSSVMSLEDAKELKSLYRTLMKRLHPDLCPGDEQRALYFRMAQQAYEQGDVEALRSIEVATAGFEPAMEGELGSAEEANAELTLLEAQVQVLKERLESLVCNEPYVLRDLLADPVWVKTRIDALKGEIEESREAIRRYEERLRELKGVVVAPSSVEDGREMADYADNE